MACSPPEEGGERPGRNSVLPSSDGDHPVAPAKPQDWSAEIAELRARQAAAREMGGPDKIQIQRDKGKWTVRERIDALLDPDSFRELGSITGRGEYGPNGELTDFTPANCV